MKNKFSQWFHSLQTRSSLMLLITAAVLIEVTGLVQYFFARDGIRDEVQQRARTELQVRNLQIQNIAGSVETAIDNMQWIIDWSVYNPDSIYSTLKLIIKNNPIITGCAMAFEPDYFPEQGRWYEPFAGRSDGLSGDIVYRQIGSADHDYLNATWYREALKAEGGMWTEPYIDEAGSKMMVCSYTMPIHDHSGRVVGVFCSDVSIEWLVDLFGYNDGMYTFLASSTGRLLACPDKNMVMTTTLQEVSENYHDTTITRVKTAMLAHDSGSATIHNNDGEKSYMYYAPVEGGTGWTMAVIFPDREIYRGLRTVGMNLVVFMVIGLALMVFIMWRTVRGFRKLSAVNAEKERIASELHIASAIQKGMLPKTFPPYPDLDEVAMYGLLVPAKEVGGDLYDFHVRGQKLFFCLGDVSGKGVPASLVMAVTRSLFRTLSAHTDSPEQVMTQMNNAMSEMNESSMFVTLFIGVLDLRTGVLAYSNAGHCPPVLMNAAGTTPFAMDANIPVGLMSNWQYTRQEVSVTSGDIIFIYTDGITEAENGTHEQFGEERMLATLQGSLGKAPRAIIDDMSGAVHTFVAGADPSDYLTMLAVQLTKTIQS
ncbi:MAG: SpoIIE family protein phosphatase [Bacteroidales bacterium]|nr:SpoIIE family protein phosphatase [Bacteroidales bacterium]